uniref:Uncharacterized protein n=1 Tax=Glossina palpalis gambiensis TaxID=67801 RepID=A0A1B0BGD8_9MUSC
MIITLLLLVLLVVGRWLFMVPTMREWHNASTCLMSAETTDYLSSPSTMWDNCCGLGAGSQVELKCMANKQTL